MTHNRDPGTGLSKKELLGGTVPLTMEWSKMAEIMKTFYKSMMLVAAAAMAFVSCQKEIENPEIDNAPKMKTIKVSTDIATRTTLDSNHENIVWSAGDTISLFNNVDATNTKLTYSAGGYIEVEVPEATTEIYTHYPYYRGNADPSSASVYIGASQTQAAPGTLNGYNFPMVAKGTVSEDNRAIVSFYPVAGALALNIYHTGLTGTETVKSVTVEPTENTGFVGRQITNLTADAVTYTNPTGTQSSVKVTLTEGLQLSNTAPTDKRKFDGQIYVCLAKQSYKSVKFTIVTDKATYEITSSAENAFDLENNDFIPVNINLAKATKEVEPTVFSVGQGKEIANIFPSVKNGIKFVYDKGEGDNTTEPIYYSPFRWYNNGTITISAGNIPINKIVFTFSGNDTGAITASTGEYAEGTWTPADNTTKSVTLTNTGTQARFSKIEVYTDDPGTEPVVTSTPTLTVNDFSFPAESSAALDVTTNYTDGTGRKIITYASSDETIATVSADGIVTGVAPGTATITATIAAENTDYYIINSVSDECTVIVTSAISYPEVSVNDWSYTFTSNPWGKDATTGDVELTSGETAINWGLTATYGGFSSGLQLGTNNSFGPATLKTNNVITNTSSVVVYARANSKKEVKLTVKAGETSLGSVVINSSEYAAYTFTSSSTVSGKISIEFTEATGGYFINQIRINPISYSIIWGTVNNGTISASATSALAGDKITLTANPADGYVLGSWSVSDASNNPVAVAGDSFTMPASNVTVSASFLKDNGNSKLELDFNLSSNPGDWPTANSTTLTDYTYSLNDVDYTFKLYNVKQNSGYLMLTSTAGLGLPALSGYKLAKVIVKNSSNCSTSTKVGISSSAPTTATYISGGEAKTFDTTSSTYTYNLSGTSANTVYYLYITSKNCQITELSLTYESVGTN